MDGKQTWFEQLNLLNLIWAIKLVSKFQIQFFLQFYWRAKKVTKTKLARVVVKSFDKSNIFAHFTFFCYCFVVS